MLSKGASREEITKLTGVPARTIGNHAEHLGEILTAAREKEILGQSIDIGKEFADQRDFVLKLRNAARDWLIDPNNPDKFSLTDRSDELEIIYLDVADKDKDGNPKRKKEALQSLIERIENKNCSVLSWTSRRADNRDLALKIIDRCDAVLTQFAKLGNLYPKPQDTELLERIALLETMAQIKTNEH